MVEKVTFSPLKFVVENLESQTYKPEVWEWFEWGHSFSLNDLPAGYHRHSAAYLDFVHAQRRLYHNNTALEMLVECFQRLQNLTQFQVDYGNRFIGAADVIAQFGRMRGDEVSRNCEATLMQVCDALYQAKVKLEVFEFGQVNDRGPRAHCVDSSPRPILPVMPVTKSRCILVNTSAVKHAFCLSYSFANASTGNIFCNLKELRVPQVMIESGWYEWGWEQERGRHQHFQAVKDAIRVTTTSTNALEKVLLGGFGDDLGRVPRTEIGEVMDYSFLRFVRELVLNNFWTTESEIQATFGRIAGTIRLVEFRRIFMSSGSTWKGALERLRELELPSLKSFIL